MRIVCLLIAVLSALFAEVALAHGPQIQITGDTGKIVTRELLLDSPYTALTSEKSAYVMPLRENLGAWYARPNGTLTMDGLPEFFSGPGLAYGYGYDPLTPTITPFTVGAKFNLAFTAGLKRWDGAAFVDAGATQLEAFTGGNPNTPSGVARTSDAGPFASLPIPGGAGTIAFAVDEQDAHSTARYRLLGDGASPTSASPDGVYLLGLQLSISPGDKAPSAPFFFVLHKNAAADVATAVASLNIDPARVQVIVPEPCSVLLSCLATAVLAVSARKAKL
jgi:hypothetical protein